MGAGAAVTAMSAGRMAKADNVKPYNFGQDLGPDVLKKMYNDMLIIRWHERTNADKRLAGTYRGSGHLYAGEEACAVGCMANLRNTGPFEQLDYVLSTHRDHGDALAKGSSVREVAAEIAMKSTGLDHGFGATMHLSDRRTGLLVSDSIIGGSPIFGMGVASGVKAKGTDQVVVAFMGDGQWANPMFHTGINNAAIRDLPLIIFITNNQYLQYGHYSMTTKLRDLADSAAAYGIPGVVVDGMDVLAVYDATNTAVKRARAGEGPTLIEAKTYRYYAHSGVSGSKPGIMGQIFGPDSSAINAFRSEREVRHYLALDPIVKFRGTLIEWGVLDETAATKIETDVKAVIADAFDFADKSPVPNPQDALKYVFAGPADARNLV
jgi:pyruvate dehydrogenase E1 component alpha subunit